MRRDPSRVALPTPLPPPDLKSALRAAGQSGWPLTCTVVIWVGSHVLEGERTSSSNDEHLQHEIVQCLDENPAEWFDLQRFAIVVAKEFRPLDEV